MQKNFFIFTLVLASIIAHSQHQLGMRLESNAGINSLLINPSLILNNKSKWEIHLAGAGLFLNNNYTYIKNASLNSLFKQRNNLEIVFDESPDGPGVFEIDFNQGSKRRFINASSYIAGPGISYKISESNTLSLFSAMRGEMGSNNIPGQYSYYHITNRPFNQPFPVKPFQAAGATWLEIGVGYAHQLPYFDKKLDIGINIKYLRGYDMMYLQSKSTYDHSIINTNDFSMSGPDFSFGYSNPESLLSSGRGRGLSLDMGVNYTLIASKEGYKLKIGAALNDLGAIKFNNITRLDLQSESLYNVRGSYFNSLNSTSTLDNVTDLFIQNVIGGTGGLTRTNTKMIITPATIILQADYALNKNLFFNGLWVQSLQYFGSGPVKGSLIAFTPRWESQWYSLSLPLSVYQWQKIRTGFAARLGYLTIGSDDVGSILFRKNFTGTDIYASLKFHFGKIDGNRYRMGKKGKKSDECYPL